MWHNAPKMLPDGSLDAVPPHPSYRPATSWVHYATSCKQNLVLVKMGEIIARNMLSWLELLIIRYCCIYLVVYIISFSDERSSKHQIISPTKPLVLFRLTNAVYFWEIKEKNKYALLKGIILCLRWFIIKIRNKLAILTNDESRQGRDTDSTQHLFAYIHLILLYHLLLSAISILVENWALNLVTHMYLTPTCS